MGKRCEPRKPAEVQVRIFGTDRHGRIFSETVSLVNLSQHGARLNGVKAEIKVDEVIGVTYGKNKVHFRVRWAGGPGTPAEGQVGLLNLHPDKPFWDGPLPQGVIDTFQTTPANDRRQWRRVKCSISVELHPAGQAVIWGKASDLSQGGCFIEMAIPLKVENKFEIVLWLGEKKLRLQGVAVSSSPGFGVGVRFTNASPQDQEFLQQHIQSLA
jgi:PilZ domain